MLASRVAYKMACSAAGVCTSRRAEVSAGLWNLRLRPMRMTLTAIRAVVARNCVTVGGISTSDKRARTLRLVYLLVTWLSRSKRETFWKESCPRRRRGAVVRSRTRGTKEVVIGRHDVGPPHEGYPCNQCTTFTFSWICRADSARGDFYVNFSSRGRPQDDPDARC